MLNGLFNARFEESDIMSMLHGHKLFLDRNTGLTNNAEKDHYVFNPEMVLSNNRHFIARAQMEAQPNGDATTEGQSLQILGFAYAYLATGLKEYYDSAKECFDAYIDHFYNSAGDNPIPSDPQRYICNWIINGKEPILANWPLSTDGYPTHGGFQGEKLDFVNGLAQIPHGEPLWGEYLDKFTFAFDGNLGWNSIVATVYALQDDGETTDWNNKGVQYDCDWVICYTGQKISGDGFDGIDIDGSHRTGSGWVISDGHPDSEKGMVKLVDTNVQGSHKACWCNRQPVEHGGYLMERNKPWHNRPMNVPVSGVLNYGNASDAEQWFLDAAYVMYKITPQGADKDRYKLVWECAQITVDEYGRIDSNDYFFRREVGALSPFTDGISYDYTYPSNSTVTYGRDSSGYIDIHVERPGGGGAQHTLEQQAVWFDVNNQSNILTTISGFDIYEGQLEGSVKIKVADSRQVSEDHWETWQAKLPYSPGWIPYGIETRMVDFYQLVDGDGNEFIMADKRMFSDYGSCKTEMQYDESVYDGRRAMVAKSTMPANNDGLVIGFWLTEEETVQPTSICVKTNTKFRASVEDDKGWVWGWDIPNTSEAWINASLDWTKITLNNYQANEQKPENAVGWVAPTRPTSWSGPKTVGQMSLSKSIDETPLAYCEWYCVNAIPKTYNYSNNRVVMVYSLTVTGDNEFSYKLGDCRVTASPDGGLKYTPGTIPFSNIYNAESSSGQFDGWHGMPYPGYQHPLIWIDNPGDVSGTKLRNMAEFLYDSQQWFYLNYGELGPGASAYIWDRWDNYKYGTPNTFTMYHWGDGHAWAGYQPRAYFSAARAWYELTIKGYQVPEKLSTYVENWTSFLYKKMVNNGGVSPTDFTVDGKVVCDPDDFTGHMCALWLAGSCISYLAGSKVHGIESLIEMLVNELSHNYIITGIPGHVMDGSWSPGTRTSTGSGPENNGMFFGFWSGEILRALSLYSIYKQMKPGDDMYALVGRL